MAKLTKQAAQQADKAAQDWGSGRFPLLEPGPYLLRLLEVDATKSGPKGPYWSWMFEEANTRTRLWHNTSLSAEAIGSLGATFRAFGVTADYDTDDLIGHQVCAVVGQRTMQGGARKGEVTNNIESMLPASEHPDYDPSDGPVVRSPMVYNAAAVADDEEPF